MVNFVTARDSRFTPQCIKVVICRFNTQIGFQNPLCDKCQIRRNAQLGWLNSDLQTFFIRPLGNCDIRIFQCRFIQVSCRSRLIGQGAAARKRVGIRTFTNKRLTIATKI